MNLGKRASLLILPVVIIGYLMVAWVVYKQECDTLHQLEKNRLDYRAGQIQSAFFSYSTFLEAYLVSLIEGDTLSAYLKEPENIYRGRMLDSHLKASIERVRAEQNTFASLTVLNPDHSVSFYIENSTDPFAEVRPQQIFFARKMENEKKLRVWEHINLDDGSSLLQQAVAIDSRTLAKPTPSQLSSASKVIVAVAPSRFDRLLKITKDEYGADIRYMNWPHSPDGQTELKAEVKLGKDYFLVIQPHPSYMDTQMEQLQLRMFSVLVFSSLITFIVLQLLIRKFITNPIANLDEQLTDVINNQKDNIDCPDSRDEVGRLGQKFYTLYEKLNQAFQTSFNQARTDSLTDLPNRASFYDTVNAQLLQAEKEQTLLSIVYIDLDNFKFVNDKYGHEMGDELLRSISQKLRHLLAINLGPSDVPSLYRLSGDEFIAVFPDCSNKEVKKLGKKILKQFENGFHFERGNFGVTVSLGIASYPEDGHTLSQLVSNADLAMYQAKKGGKNRISAYSKELAKNDRKVKEIESLLKEMNPDEELSLHYMPVVDPEGNTKGCEALLRWNSPHLGMISPAVFIPIAEETGVFEVIDAWVVEQCFKDLPDLKAILGEQFTISINISSAELNSERFIEHLEMLCAQYPVSTKYFMLEITETFAMDQSSNSVKWLGRLQQLGFRIAIDDFGTGYTSLMQMVDFPVDVIKFDMKLTARITEADRQHLARALIDLCHIQNIEVVAEGVETQGQRDCLIDAKCDFLQGYLIAKPMPINNLREWVQRYGHQVVVTPESVN